MSDVAIDARLEAAKQFAIKAGKQTLELFQNQQLNVELKKDRSPVTLADRNAEQLIRKLIGEHFPDDGIVGEEFPEKTGSNEIRWILDPIDGTKSFISGVPLYGTMVGVEISGEPTIGVVYIPGLDEGAYAAIGNGAWHFQGTKPAVKAQVSGRKRLSDAVLVTSESETFKTRAADEVYAALTEQVYFSRTWGDCYGYLLVATGRVDIMIDPILNIWDAAAVSPIMKEAGGVFVDWAGNSRIDAGEAIGTNPLLLDQILQITRGHAGRFSP